jgi:hypothetical protein
MPERAWAILKDIIGGFKDTVQIEELKELIGAIETYVEKVCVHILKIQYLEYLHKDNSNFKSDASEL